MQNVKIALEKLLEDRGVSMYKLAKDTDTAYSTIFRMTKKEIDSIDLKILKKICDNLNCTPNDLLPIAK